MTRASFRDRPDLASRRLGGGVPWASDELFAERENLIKPGAAVFETTTFGHKGKVYDGWETRRRREPGNDHAVVRLGAPGVIAGVVIDTSWFVGNYPPHASVEATSVEGYPCPGELDTAGWQTIVHRAPLRGDAINPFPVTDAHRFTHVRLSIYPDGGVARFRVHGDVVPDPRLLPAAFDLAALENGGTIADCSNMFYSSPVNLIMPGRARTMADGWENARRRDDGNDYVTFALPAPAVPSVAELDTSYFVGNAPGWVSLQGMTDDDAGEWVELLARTRLQPDTPHRFRLRSECAVTRVRMDVFPDGGLARVRLHGSAAPGHRRRMGLRWFNALPDGHARVVAEQAVDPDTAATLVAARPIADPAALPEPVLQSFG